jgi:glycine/D-amino acid oxidase-like deaminating enzyme
MARRIAVIGAGIVGTAVAERLSVRSGCTVTVLDQAREGHLSGSTGHAPGFVGVLAPDASLTELARESIAVYRSLLWRGFAGFAPVGGLDLAESAAGGEALATRAAMATEVGVPATLIRPADAAKRAPRLVDPARVEVALDLPWDGAARACVITAALGARAAAAGVRFRPDAKVVGIDLRGDRVVRVRTPTESFGADDVVVACGIWGPSVAALAGVELPQFPAGHPYVRSASHARTRPPSPLVRWLEQRAYTRDDGNRNGLGTSNHDPLLVQGPFDRAELAWPGGMFDRAVTSALALLPQKHRWSPAEQVHGLLSVTPDGLPLLGALGRVHGLWSAQAIWVTHAAGAARALVAQMFDELTTIGHLAPQRFADEPPDALRRRAVTAYRDGRLRPLTNAIPLGLPGA